MKRIIRKYGPPIFHCINDFGQGSLAALIPFFIANFGLNYYQSASIIFCNTVVASVAQPVLGYVADRWRVPWFIPVGFTVTLVSISAMAMATSYEMILALSLLAGVGAAPPSTTAPRVLKATRPTSKRRPTIALASTSVAASSPWGLSGVSSRRLTRSAWCIPQSAPRKSSPVPPVRLSATIRS